MWFEGGDIRLRALEPEDLDWLYALENNDALWEWGCSNVPYSRYALKNYIAMSKNDIYTDGQLRLVVVSKEGDAVLGCVDLVDFSPRHLRAEIGIMLYPEYRGRGYGLQVLRLLSSYARQHLFLHQLYALVSQNNEQARRLFLKAGFSQEAVLKDWLRDKNGDYTDANMFSLLL